MPTTIAPAMAQRTRSRGLSSSSQGSEARSFRLPYFEADQRDLEIARRAQLVHHRHDLAVGHAAVGAQEDAIVLVAAGRGSSALAS